MTNRLAQSNSPYLLQHKDNPVDWYPWGDEALTRAKEENKPIFLSVGYAACHWCHVMAHESFEDESTAAIMNEHFINIKVDREERPDIDGIYMDAVVALTGSGGWPMSVFLAPDGKAFLGGTYFPPEPRHQLPSFKQALQHVIRIWDEEQEAIQKTGDQLIARIEAQVFPDADQEKLQPEKLSEAVMSLARTYDWQKGGWGQAPKFPQAMAIDYLLGRATQDDKMARDMAEHALQAMAQGGMYDLAGGGFARYSVDDDWLVPHFEKMLYDNALLSRAYLHAYMVTGKQEYRRVCEASLDFVIRELRSGKGAFYSSLDADSEGEEGKFYVWDEAEISSLLGVEAFAKFAEKVAIPENGNFEGRLILRKNGLESLSESEHTKLSESFDILMEARGKRIRPATDDKAITGWNAMMLQSFAEAGRYLKRVDYLEIARENAQFIFDNLFADERLLRSYRKGKAEHLGLLDDYAALVLALLELYQSDPDPKWYSRAEKLGREMLRLFVDDDEFFDTGIDHEKLIVRPRNNQDNATPSGAALACLALLKLYAFSGDGALYDVAMRNLLRMQDIASQHPTSFAIWLQAMSFASSEGKEVALIEGEDLEMAEKMRSLMWEKYRPFDVLAQSSPEKSKQGPELLAKRPLLDSRSTIYVCRNFECKLPVNDLATFEKLIS